MFQLHIGPACAGFHLAARSLCDKSVRCFNEFHHDASMFPALSVWIQPSLAWPFAQVGGKIESSRDVWYHQEGVFAPGKDYPNRSLSQDFASRFGVLLYFLYSLVIFVPKASLILGRVRPSAGGDNGMGTASISRLAHKGCKWTFTVTSMGSNMGADSGMGSARRWWRSSVFWNSTSLGYSILHVLFLHILICSIILCLYGHI